MALLYALCIVFLSNFVHFGTSIRCYQCNSANNSMCLNPEIYDRESVVKYLHTTDCARSTAAPAHHAKEMFCRKIVQTILHKGHEPEVRVTRGCGWVKHRRDCYKADNEDHLETVCQCFSDDCNAAATTSCGVLALLTAFSLKLVL